MTVRFIDPWTPKTPGPFRIGDRVRAPFGGQFIEATIVEDHGNLGSGGKRLYGIRYRLEGVPEEMYTEREADRLTLIARAATPKDAKSNGQRE